MKNTNIILQREDSTKIFISSKNSVRSWVKLFLTLIYSAMVFISLLSIEKFNNQDRLEWIFSLIWILIVISIIKSLMIINIKALYYSFRGFFISLLMYCLSIGYGFFLAFYTTTIKVTNPIHFNDIFIYLTPAAMFIGFWKIVISLEERKTMPHFTKPLFFDGFTQMLFGVPTILSSLSMEKIITDIKDYGIKGLTNNFYNSLMFYLIAVLFILIFSLQIFKWYKFGKDSSSPWLISNTIFANAFITMIPLAIWFVFQYGVWINSFVSFIYVGIIAVLVIMLIYFSFLTKYEARRSKLFMSYAAMFLTFVWGMWFIYDYISKDINGFMFSTTLATLASGFVVGIIYIKGPELTKWISLLYKVIINSIMYIVIILLVNYYVTAGILEALTSVVNIFNLGLLALPIMFLTATLMS